MKISIIYLDVCALCRPFDNQDYLRIRMENEAVNLILSNIRAGKCRLLYSTVHLKEIEAIEGTAERIELLTLLNTFGENIARDTTDIRHRAEELFKDGFGVADAAHVAYAEIAAADFVTCDDRLIKKCHRRDVKVWCGDPMAYCEKEGLK